MHFLSALTVLCFDHSLNKYFEFKKLVGRRGAPELELLAVVIVLFSPILHETLKGNCIDFQRELILKYYMKERSLQSVGV